MSGVNNTPNIYINIYIYIVRVYMNIYIIYVETKNISDYDMSSNTY